MFSQTRLVEDRPRRLNVPLPRFRQERELMALGTRLHWPFRVLVVGPVPAEPFLHDGWWFVPIHQDHSEIPPRSLQRVRAIYEAGIRPKAFVIAHEAPRQLSAPASMPKVSRFELDLERMARYSVTAAKVVGVVAAAVVIPLLLAVVGATAVVALGLASATVIDPCLIAVTENDVWIEIDRWVA